MGFYTGIPLWPLPGSMSCWLTRNIDSSPYGSKVPKMKEFCMRNRIYTLGMFRVFASYMGTSTSIKATRSSSGPEGCGPKGLSVPTILC